MTNTPTVRQGIYLEDNPPVRSQFRAGRRDEPIAQVIVHTAESGTDKTGADPKAENVASWITRRTDAGSYHLLGDSDSIIPMVRFENEAFHCRGGFNRWSIGICLAMNAADWKRLHRSRRDELIETAAVMTVMAARWFKEEHGLILPIRWLNRREAQAKMPGIVSHADADPTPGRRSDPGAGFPVGTYLARTKALLTGTQMAVAVPTPIRALADAVRGQADAVEALQASMVLMGALLKVDGVWGPITEAAAERYLVGRGQDVKVTVDGAVVFDAKEQGR